MYIRRKITPFLKKNKLISDVYTKENNSIPQEKEVHFRSMYEGKYNLELSSEMPLNSARKTKMFRINKYICSG